MSGRAYRGTGWSRSTKQAEPEAKVASGSYSLSPGRPTILENWILTKHRLMLSAAAAALLATPWLIAGVRADTEISSQTKSALSTATSGNITIETNGSVDISTSSVAAITINSNNSLANNGSISNTDVDNATGILIDTTAGNIVAPGVLINNGSIDLSGKGAGKTGILISGGNIYFGSIDLLHSPAPPPTRR